MRRAAFDSTGMDCGHRSQYYVHRRSKSDGKPQKIRYSRYAKLEAGFDCRTHLFIAAIPRRGPAVDTNRFVPLLEAARLEGATYRQQLHRIVLPLLMPTTLFISVNAVIGAFRLVDHVVAMTKGGPDNATMLLLFQIYQVGFSFWDTGYAAALTVVLLVILSLIALFQFGYADKRVHYR